MNEIREFFKPITDAISNFADYIRDKISPKVKEEKVPRTQVTYQIQKTVPDQTRRADIFNEAAKLKPLGAILEKRNNCKLEIVVKNGSAQMDVDYTIGKNGLSRVKVGALEYKRDDNGNWFMGHLKLSNTELNDHVRLRQALEVIIEKENAFKQPQQPQGAQIQQPKKPLTEQELEQLRQREDQAKSQRAKDAEFKSTPYLDKKALLSTILESAKNDSGLKAKMGITMDSNREYLEAVRRFVADKCDEHGVTGTYRDNTINEAIEKALIGHLHDRSSNYLFVNESGKATLDLVTLCDFCRSLRLPSDAIKNIVQEGRKAVQSVERGQLENIENNDGYKKKEEIFLKQYGGGTR
ncbi:MAG: hypothetical protein JSR46_01850 [Verrucomicrobia bacterium]|nr:hypothetical protein [Verrucomicrobiota bacterium]